MGRRFRAAGALIVVIVGIAVPQGAGAAEAYHHWSKRMGTSTFDNANATAIGPSGVVAIAGASMGTSIDLGGGPMPGAGSWDIHLALYDASGGHLWSGRFGGFDADEAHAVAFTPSGDVVVAGRSHSPTIDLGGGLLAGAGNADIVVAKFSAAGAHLWSKRMGGTAFDYAASVASDASGNVIVSGSAASPTIDLGGGVLAGAGADDVVVAAYSPSGAHLWSRRMGGSGVEWGLAVAADPAGNVVLAGASESLSIDLGGGGLARVGGHDVIVAKYDAAGTHQWSKRLVGNGEDVGTGIATDAAGTIVVGGYTRSTTLDLGGGPAPSLGGADIFFVSLTPEGYHNWSKRLGGAGGDFATSVAFTRSGAVIVAGRTDGTSIDFGGGPLVGGLNNDIVVASFSADSLYQWSRRIGGSGSDIASAVAAGPSGEVVLAGTSGSTSIDLGGGAMTGFGSNDAVVARYRTDDTAPVSTIEFLIPVTSATLSLRVAGTATDDMSGVAGVTVSFTNLITAETVAVEAVLSCDAPRTSCTYQAHGPATVGLWTANARARDVARNTESPGPSRLTLGLI